MQALTWRYKLLTVSILMLALVLAGCAAAEASPTPVPTTSTPAPSVTPTAPDATSTPAPTAAAHPVQPDRVWTLADGLTVEEYALLEAPSTDMVFFRPRQGSMADVLARRADYRSGVSKVQCYGLSCTVTSENGTEFVVENQFNADGSNGWATVKQNGLEIYTIQTGPGSPLDPLHGFWANDEHWVLETAKITVTRQVVDGVTTVFSTPLGQISQDGELLNAAYQYDEMFGYQRMAGKPFYFYQQDGKINLSFDGASVATEYDAVPHYGCCSAGLINPVPYKNMLTFYAQRAGSWYYVELGVFD